MLNGIGTGQPKPPSYYILRGLDSPEVVSGMVNDPILGDVTNRKETEQRNKTMRNSLQANLRNKLGVKSQKMQKAFDKAVRGK
jgi:hypothetical protein